MTQKLLLTNIYYYSTIQMISIIQRFALNHFKHFNNSLQKVYLSQLFILSQFCTTSQSESNIQTYINNQRTIEVLKKKGVTSLFPVQYKTFKMIYDGSDIITSDRTGSGKTLAYCLPVLEKIRMQRQSNNSPSGTKFLIMAPTRQLALQVTRELQELTNQNNQFNIVTVYGGSSIEGQIREIRRGADIIVATPGRLIDLLNRGDINFSNLQTICLDEADEMLAKGFQEDIENIIKQALKVNKNTSPMQFLLFSATMPSWVIQISEKYMRKDKNILNLITNGEFKMRTSTTVQHFAIQSNNKEIQETAKLINLLINQYGKQGRVIIFVKTKREAFLLSNILQDCVPIHGDLSQRQRQFSLQKFSSDKTKINILVATDVAARGLDIDNVELVIQNNPPQLPQSYIHRSGRTGRMGKKGICITIFDRWNVELLLNIQRHANIKIQPILAPQKYRLDIRKLVDQLNSASKIDKKRAEQMIEKIASESKLNRQQVLQRVFQLKMKEQGFLDQFTGVPRSFITNKSGFITYLISPNHQSFQVNKYIKNQFPAQIVQDILSTIKLNDYQKQNYIFDINESYQKTLEEFIKKSKIKIQRATSRQIVLPPLKLEQDRRFGNRNNYSRFSIENQGSKYSNNSRIRQGRNDYGNREKQGRNDYGNREKQGRNYYGNREKQGRNDYGNREKQGRNDYGNRERNHSFNRKTDIQEENFFKGKNNWVGKQRRKDYDNNEGNDSIQRSQWV